MLRLSRSHQHAKHLMIVHVLSARKKMVLFDLFGLQHAIDRFIVYATWQKQFIERRWSVPSERVILSPFMVDTGFFHPAAVSANPQPMICSVGLERRDYPTLMQAVQGLPAQVVIAAASPWSKQPDQTKDRTLPENVVVQRYSQYALRQLYADCRFLVMPLQNVTFQAGVTAILEAMAMGKAVICTRTPGQTDVVIDGETGIYVPPGDPIALRAAIERLLHNPAEAERMGAAGQKRANELMNLDRYASLIAGWTRAATGMPSDQPTPPTSAAIGEEVQYV
jgi:glycosyltransferase involved in cell wall biosynthesis